MIVAQETHDSAGVRDYEDAAWVRVMTTLAVADLRGFLDDVERLYRINPLLEISIFESTGGRRYRVKGKNLSNASDLDVELDVKRQDAEIQIIYSRGLKAATHFRAETAPGGSCLVVTDIYGGSAEERRARAGEVDLSLNAWGRALHDYLALWARWNWFAPWRWYMRRVWQPMTPSARRIVWMIWVISIFEVAAIALLFLILGALQLVRS